MAFSARPPERTLPYRTDTLEGEKRALPCCPASARSRYRRAHPEVQVMRIVVFGATGNVGRRIVAEALRRGHEVVGVVRDPEAVQSPDPRVRLVRGDATDAASIAAAARGADAVVSAISPRPNPR